MCFFIGIGHDGSDYRVEELVEVEGEKDVTRCNLRGRGGECGLEIVQRRRIAHDGDE